jgi:hypothetical protein
MNEGLTFFFAGAAGAINFAVAFFAVAMRFDFVVLLTDGNSTKKRFSL